MNNKLKRALALVLCTVLALSALPVGSLAVDTPVIRVENATVSTGSGAQSLSLPVSISNTLGFAGMDLSFSLPEGWVLENISIKEKDDYSIFYVEDSDGNMQLLTKPTANPAKGRFLAAHSVDIMDSGYLCWLSITVPGDAPVGKYEIKLSANKINPASSSTVDISDSYSLIDGCVNVIRSGVSLSQSTVVSDEDRSLTATAIDDEGNDLSSYANWSVSPSGKGVSISRGLVTVERGTEAGEYVIAAQGVGEAILRVCDIKVEIEGDAASIPELVYGLSWDEVESSIVINKENIKVLADSELEGSFFTKLERQSSKPNAGSHSYEIIFENEEYGVVSIHKGLLLIKPAQLALPEVVEGLVYNGGEQTGVTAAEGCSVSGGSATDAGSYTATLIPDSNHCWPDGRRDAKEISWSIAPKALDIRWTNTQCVYNGQEQYPKAEAEGIALEISGGRDAGTYTCTATAVGSNYILTNNSCRFTILPSEEFNDATAKSQRAIVGSVSFAEPRFVGFGSEAVEGEISYSFEGESVSYDALCEKLSAYEKGIFSIDYAFLTSGNYKGERQGSISLELEDMAFYVGTEQAKAENALKLKDSPTFGDTWAEIAELSDELEAGILGQKLEGEFYLNVSGSPNAGEHRVIVMFSGGEYENIPVLETAISVAPASAEVCWGESSFTYNGEAQCPKAEALDIKGKSLTLELEGAATESGSYTARAVCEDKNYVLTNAEKDFTIAKAVYEGEVKYTPIDETGKTLAEADLKPGKEWGAGTLLWQDADGNPLPDSTVVEMDKEYFWSFTPENPNYEPLEGGIVVFATGYALHIDENIQNGSISLSTLLAKEGERVYVTAKGEKGYGLGEVQVRDSWGNAVGTEPQENGASFFMPGSEVYVSALFTKLGLPFTDVAEGAWYYEPIHYAYYNGLMNGISAQRFEPGTNLTRAMMMTILARLAGVDTSGGSPWYEKGMVWAMENGVSDGTNPGLNITREQVVTMLYRYIGEPEVEAKGLESFLDGDSTSSWAEDAMNWAIEKGLMKGDDKGNVNPRNNATRAEISTIFQRFIENVM